MNNTQAEIIGVVFGFTFSIPSVDELFLQYISPIILKESSNPTMPILIALLTGLVFLASLSGIFIILKNIEKTWNFKSSREFDDYMKKNVITLGISLIIALLLKNLFYP